MNNKQDSLGHLNAVAADIAKQFGITLEQSVLMVRMTMIAVVEQSGAQVTDEVLSSVGLCRKASK